QHGVNIAWRCPKSGPPIDLDHNWVASSAPAPIATITTTTQIARRISASRAAIRPMSKLDDDACAITGYDANATDGACGVPPGGVDTGAGSAADRDENGATTRPGTGTAGAGSGRTNGWVTSSSLARSRGSVLASCGLAPCAA